MTVVLVIINLFGLVLGLLVGEYQLSSWLHPEASWLPLATVAVTSLVVGLLGLSFFNLAVLYFTIRRGLSQHLAWLWKVTLILLIVGISLTLVLGKYFIPVVFPG